MTEPMTPLLRRCDLFPSIVIFGGLLIALTALGGAAMEGAPGWADEVKVLGGENVVGTEEMDILAACKQESQKRGDIDRRCRQSAIRAQVR